MIDLATLLAAATLIVTLIGLLWRYWAEHLRRLTAENKSLLGEVAELEQRLRDARSPSTESKQLVAQLVPLCQAHLVSNRPTAEQLQDEPPALKQLLAELSFLTAEAEAKPGGDRDTLIRYGSLAADLMRQLEREGQTQWNDQSLLEAYLDLGRTVLGSPFHAAKIEQLVSEFQHTQRAGPIWSTIKKVVSFGTRKKSLPYEPHIPSLERTQKARRSAQ